MSIGAAKAPVASAARVRNCRRDSAAVVTGGVGREEELAAGSAGGREDGLMLDE